MSAHVQPDLFGEYDAAQERSMKWEGTPPPCPSCGGIEKYWHLMAQNHGYRPGEEGICGFPIGQHPIYGAMCSGQYLKRNHIIYAIWNDLDPSRDVEIARRMGLDTDAIIREAKENRP